MSIEEDMSISFPVPRRRKISEQLPRNLYREGGQNGVAKNIREGILPDLKRLREFFLHRKHPVCDGRDAWARNVLALSQGVMKLIFNFM
jgi:hypothetical protein